MTTTQTAQAVTLALCIVGLVVWLVWLARNLRHWGYAMPPLAGLIHGVAFYGVVFARDFGWLPWMELTFWSVVLRLHWLLLLTGVGVIMLLEKLVINGEK